MGNGRYWSRQRRLVKSLVKANNPFSEVKNPLDLGDPDLDIAPEDLKRKKKSIIISKCLTGLREGPKSLHERSNWSGFDKEN